MTKEKQISHENPPVKWTHWLSYGWLAMSFILLLFNLKPFDKALKNADHTHYSVECQNDSVTGYSVDYNGVVDFVAYPYHCCVSKFVFKESSVYRLRFANKNKAFNTIRIVKNGYEVDSFSVSSKRNVNVELYANDELKIIVSSLDASKPEVAVKFQTDNSLVQRSIYYILAIWLMIGIWLTVAFGGIHLILPSVWLLLACYNEHLYEPESWMLPMFGFIGITALITAIRFLLAKTSLGIVSKSIVLLFDYVVLIMSTVLLGFIWNYKRYGYRLDYDTVIALLQTNVKESIEFALAELGWIAVLLVILVFLIPFVLWFLGNKTKLKEFKFKNLGLVVVATIVGSGLIGQSQFITQVKSAYSQYYQELKKFNVVQKRFSDPGNIEASKSETGETYVFVIGESQSKEHMSLYGYHRNTTPLLDSLSKTGDMTVFGNAFSSHTHTIMVLRDALTQANQYNGLNFTNVPSLINVLNAADFETVWLSNQVKLSNWDNIVSAIAVGCDKQIFVNKNIGEAVRNSPYDERVLPELENLLSDKTTKNRVIFVHLLGNHGQYAERYPSRFKTLPSKGAADYGVQGDLKIWEAYDNSIRYNDSILYEICDIVNTFAKGPSMVSYFADHAEDLSGNRGHNSGQFTFRMTQIPMFIWCNKDYQNAYTDTWKRIGDVKERLFSNDLFFQMGLDLTNVKTPLIDSKYNVLSANYSIDTLKTKSGAIVYDNPSNGYTNLKRNVVFIDTTAQLNRIGVHRVNSFGKLNEVQKSGLRTIELDVKYIDGVLMVGHGEAHVMSGLTLETYIAELNLLNVDKIWLDIKNLSAINLQEVITALSALEERFRIKSRLIVETQSQEYAMSKIAQMGFNVSYYLPTNLAEKSPSEQDEEAVKIANQLKYQKVTSISFDAKLYDFVKAKLESKINPNIQYHTWDLNLNVRNGHFSSALQEQRFYLDTRVKTILVSYPSVFEL